uniref:Cation channel sperm-associated protein subunit gamma-like n=1 Tax=Saccoglossus kowalevskii TaxID=10224 RepID=A0ABM0MJQ8_SACKO|nr:PREDICTED: cation channel sperm-associated protein subunit gamma-like [Saccoglossus kowalevskii]
MLYFGNRIFRVLFFFLLQIVYSGQVCPNYDIRVDCAWRVDVVQQNLNLTTVSVIKPADLIPVSSIISDKALNLVVEDELTVDAYYSYPYALQIQITCCNEITPSVIRNSVATGMSPKVIVSSTNKTRGTVQHVLSAILIDLVELGVSTEMECQHTLCHPAWVVPLPLDNQTHSVHVEVTTNGIGLFSHVYRKTIYHEYFETESEVNMLGEKILLNDTVIDEVSSSDSTIVVTKDSMPSIFKGKANTLLFSQDHFQTVDVLKIELPSDRPVCNVSTTEPMLYDSLVLTEKILLGTSRGLYEISEDYINVLEVCVKMLISPLQQSITDSNMLAVTEHRDVYTIGYKSENDYTLTFSILAGHSEGSICDFLENVVDTVESENCSVVSASIDPTQQDTYLFLLRVTIDISHDYFLVEYAGTQGSGSWELVTSVADIDNWSDFQDISVGSWCGLSYTTLVSSHLFIWGNAIIQSADNGRTLYLMSMYPVHDKSIITVATFSLDGAFAVLNQMQEVWYGIVGNFNSITKLVPTSTSVLLSNLMLGDAENTTTLAVFFDSYNQLYQLMVLSAYNATDVISRYLVPVTDIITGQNFVDSQNDGIDGLECSSRSCPYIDIRFEAPISQNYSRIEKYTYEAPCHKYEYAGNLEALYVYQGLVHRIIQQCCANTKIYDEDSISGRLPDTIYLDRNQSYKFSLRISVDDSSCNTGTAALQKTQVQIDVSDQLLDVFAERQVHVINNTVIYQVTVQESDVEVGVVSHFPAKSISLMLQIWNSAFKCITHRFNEKHIEGSYVMNVMLGCPPGKHLIFDMKQSLDFSSSVSEVAYDCPVSDPEMPCLYYENGFYPHFYIEEMSTGHKELFTGKYIMKIIGGGLSILEITHYSSNEIAMYNSNRPHATPVMVGKNTSEQDNDGMFIYTHQTKGIIWHCQAQSPCGNVPLAFPYAPEYYFLIEVSNSYILVYLICNRYVWKRFKSKVLNVEMELEELEQSLSESRSASDMYDSSDEEVIAIHHLIPSRDNFNKGSTSELHVSDRGAASDSAASLHKRNLKKKLEEQRIHNL